VLGFCVRIGHKDLLGLSFLRTCTIVVRYIRVRQHDNGDPLAY
jgi:hypothetical protein